GRPGAGLAGGRPGRRGHDRAGTRDARRGGRGEPTLAGVRSPVRAEQRPAGARRRLNACSTVGQPADRTPNDRTGRPSDGPVAWLLQRCSIVLRLFFDCSSVVGDIGHPTTGRRSRPPTCDGVRSRANDVDGRGPGLRFRGEVPGTTKRRREEESAPLRADSSTTEGGGGRETFGRRRGVRWRSLSGTADAPVSPSERRGTGTAAAGHGR